MFIKVGPFIGVSEKEARIWIKAQPNSDLVMELVPPSGESVTKTIQTSEDGIGIAEFSGLSPDTRYSYSLRHRSGERLLKEIDEPGFFTFPSPGEDCDLTFAFYSCHNPKFVSGTEGAKPDSMQMWKELGNLCRPSLNTQSSEEPRFLLAIGDQIYADELWKRRNRRKYARASHQEIVEAYSGVYDKFLGLRQIQAVSSRCPIFMTWDDHEIRDGWGSHGDEHTAALQRMFQAAKEAYVKYQLSHNPHILQFGQRYYGFRYGRIGFVVLDLRGYRSAKESELLGSEQWEWLDNWLQNEAPHCRVVFVVCSVPFIHLTHQVTKLRSKWLAKIFMKIFGLADDFVDQWNSEPFIKEAQQLAEVLFELANEKGVRFVLLGGDVHVATFAVLRSYRKADEFHPLIYQLTSSPISNKPTKVAKFLKLFAPEIDLSEDLPFKGRLLRIIPERNFGIVKLRRHPDTGDYAVIFEVHSQETGVQRFATLW